MKGVILMEIKLVILQTKNIIEMRRFYINTLGFPLIKEDDNGFRFAVGSSELEFTSNEINGNPYYHFAFNIPANKFNEAKAWTKKRVNLNMEEGEDEVDFAHLPAHALYFDDPAGNVVEFISRHSVAENSTEPFSIKSVLNISEIGLTVDDVVSASKSLSDVGVIERDNGEISKKNLNFMGERGKGIFIILNEPERRWIFSDKISAIYPLSITLSNNNKIVVNSEKKLQVYPIDVKNP
jgi:catechol 2,3-dioxygenase-like lactoylglutathione lyase family enzyme